ncbi:MAG: carbohydrate ABC transporter permease, partial [Phototrophicaceae bacterium]
LMSPPFGTTMPLTTPPLVVAFGYLLLRLAGMCYRGEIGGARWAVTVYNWLMVLSGIAVFSYALRLLQQSDGLTLNSLGIYALALVCLVGVRRGVVLASRRYRGEEIIQSQEARRAWNLLTPLLLVFLAIASTPLEQVFITSTTNARFASSEQPSFIGLENYFKLASVRIDVLPCTVGEDGQCLTETDPDTGEERVVYPRPREVVGDEYRDLRYRDINEFDLFGRHLVISARDQEFIAALVTSITYTFWAILIQFTLGFFMALIIAQRVRGIGLLRVVMLVPLAIPTLIATQFWDVMLRPDASGIFNDILLRMGFIQSPLDWLTASHLQIPILVAVIVWKETPLTALMLLPGVLAIPQEVYQAAGIDGANRWQRFWTMTMPLMRPTLGVALILRTMVFIRVFDLFQILMAGQARDSLATYAFDVLTIQQDLGMSSTISVVMFIIIFLFTLWYMRLLNVDES